MAAGLAYVSYKANNGRPVRGIMVQNSWGPWNESTGNPRGSLTPDMPVGAFICHLDDFAKVLSSGDCWSYSGFKGFQNSPFNWEAGLGW